jgi:hypothetical protein
MAMKIFTVFVIAATLLLPAIAFRSFANTDKCNTTVCCDVTKKCMANKKTEAELIETETNPFTILIPGNHF